MRIFYFKSNIDFELAIEGCKFSKSTNVEDMEILFTKDMINVVSEQNYEEVSSQRYMYAIGIGTDASIFKNISKVFSAILLNYSDVLVVYDASSMRYINIEELKYYSNKIMHLSKLFTIEIVSREFFCEYKTRGLSSLGLEEFKVTTPFTYDEKVYMKFKQFVINYIIKRETGLVIIREECNVVDYEEMMNLDIAIENLLYAQNIKHLIDNFELFKSLYGKIDGKFYLNDELIESKEQIDFTINLQDYKQKVAGYKIVTEDMIYDPVNIFYASKFLD